MFDVAVIGAGIAGLTVAQQLHQAGYKVVVVDKSRGVGGRVATRRLQGTCADHGLRYLEPQGKLSEKLIDVLGVQQSDFAGNRGILQVWENPVYEWEPAKPNSSSLLPRYVAPMGMNAIAKFLATGLEMQMNQRVQEITATDEKTWHFTFEQKADPLIAKAVVVAIPAPQALMLLEPLAKTIPTEFLDSLRAVEFDPCLSVMAGYPASRQQDLSNAETGNFPLHLDVTHDSDLSWIGLDSSKRPNPQMPVFVLHSTAEFANRYLDAEDLNPVARQMLSHAAQLLVPWLDSPEWFQIHCWRYAFPSRPLDLDCLDAGTPLPLVCCGDWCGGNLVEGAMNSGLAAAVKINQQMEMRSLPGESFLEALQQISSRSDR
ncbi:FAD-dependent oxidoreductase [Coleofasciculus sp. FACHB-1120]|uniref:FAD-dependent oxidoreductase n=1 Tax=Coleofasciculus sp. FACHB-1120 TaxID=2692783 RepID=UPI00168448DE|nr:FAD-dependent oxidoreductase [Coleofasciculus sp. FACHB-1120]